MAAITATIAASSSRGEIRFTVRLYDQLVTLEIDHLIACVDDLDEAGERYQTDFGLISVVGGRHTGHGTANRIVPLGTAYIELVAVVDPDEAIESPFGSWVQDHADRRGFDALVMRTDDIDSVAGRLGLEPLAMARVREDGVELSWRLAGLDQLLSDGLPPIIQWDVDEALLPGRSPTDPPNPSDGFDQVVITGDATQLTSWTRGCPGLRIVDGPPGIGSVRVQGVELA